MDAPVTLSRCVAARPERPSLCSSLLSSSQLAGCGSGKSTPPFVGPTLKNPSTAPSFALRDQHGQVVSIEGQRGKVALITFLYTHCPDVCPLTAMNLNTALGLIGAKRTDVVVLAVSVDPRGDTRAAVASFVRSHHLRPQFHYLTGSAQALQRVWRAYNVTAVRRGAGGDKGVDHTLYTMLVDPRARLASSSTRWRRPSRSRTTSAFCSRRRTITRLAVQRQLCPAAVSGANHFFSKATESQIDASNRIARGIVSMIVVTGSTPGSATPTTVTIM